MLNSILMVIGALIVILIVFVVFSQDDDDLEDPGDRDEGDLEGTERSATPPTSPGTPPATAGPPMVPGLPGTRDAATPMATSPVPTTSPTPTASPAPLAPRGPAAASGNRPASTLPATGSEVDFQLRLLSELPPAPITSVTPREGVVAVVQLRLSLDDVPAEQDLRTVLLAADDLFAPRLAQFPFTQALGHQGERILFFGLDQHRDDPVFEALITLHDLVRRARKAIDEVPALGRAKLRLGCGVARGRLHELRRGQGGPVTWAGRPLALATTLACDAAGDFQVFVDDSVHARSTAVFDFREWKAVKLRESLPALPVFELLGLNKTEEILALAQSPEPEARHRLAVLLRYLKIDDLTPLYTLVADPADEVACAALATLHELADPRALGVLKKALNDAEASPLRRGDVIKALGAVGGDEILPVLRGSARDSHWQVRLHAVEAIRRVAGPEAARELAQFLEDPDGAVKASLHRHMFELTGDEKHLAALEGLLGDLSQRARRRAVRALVGLARPRTLAAACAAWPQLDSETRDDLLTALAEQPLPEAYRGFLSLFALAQEGERPRLVAALQRAQQRQA